MKVSPMISKDPRSASAVVVGDSPLGRQLCAVLEGHGFTTQVVTSLKKIPDRQQIDVLFLDARLFPVVPEHILDRPLSANTVVVLVGTDETTEKLFAQLVKRGKQVALVLIPDLYGPGIVGSQVSPLWSDVTKGKITLPENKDTPVAPIFIDDAVGAMARIALGFQSGEQSFVLCGEERMSSLSLAYRLREFIFRETGRLISLVPSSRSVQFSAARRTLFLRAEKTKRILGWSAQTDLEQGMRATLVSPVLKQKIWHPSATETLSHWRYRRFALILTTVFLIGVFPFGISMFMSAIGPRLSVKILQKFEPIAALFGQQTLLRRQIDAATARQTQSGLVRDLNQLTWSFFSTTDENRASRLDGLRSRVKQLVAVEKMVDPGTMKLLRDGDRLLPVFKWAMGFDRKRTLLLVLEDSNELRPTGGFIDAVGFLTLERGKVLDLNFMDVSQLDSQLTGHQPAPAPIGQYLGEQNWLIRDGNWSPDGRIASADLQRFMERATGRSVDGTVFLTSRGLQLILEQFGPVQLSGGDEVTAKNLVDRMVFADRVDVNSGDRVDTFTGVLQAIEQDIHSSDRAWRVAHGILIALAQNEILVTAADPAIAAILADASADGAILVPSCPLDREGGETPCLSDLISVVDANLGVNKADHFLNREREVAISISPDGPETMTLTLRYANVADSDRRPAGAYRGFVRVYLPADTIVNNLVEMTAENNLVEDPVTVIPDLGLVSIGWAVSVPVGQEKTYRLSVTRPMSLPIQGDVGAYALTIAKQPGVVVPTVLTVNYPDSIAPVTMSARAVTISGSFILNLTGDRTETVRAEFATVL